jgi:hypothetical protein
MTAHNTHEAKSNLPQPAESVATAPTGKRIGIAKGKFTVPDNIDNDNPAIQDMFAGHSQD